MSSTQIDRITGLGGNVAIKAPVVCVATTNITLNGEQTIDGVLTAASRVLLTGQTDNTTNGIYLTSTGNWVRTADFDGTNDIVQYTLVNVGGGTLNGKTLWYVSTASPVIGSTAIAIVKISSFTSIGTAAAENLGNNVIDDGAGNLVVKAASVTNNMLATAAANTVKGNATAGTAVPTDIALSASQLLGRGSSGNVAPITAGYGLTIGSSTIAVSQTYLTNALSSDVTMPSSTVYYDGPLIAVSSIGGSWYIDATATISNSSTAVNCIGKLWDGATVINSGVFMTGGTASLANAVNFSGIINNPSSNIRLSINSLNSPATIMRANNSGLAKDTMISAVRIA